MFYMLSVGPRYDSLYWQEPTVRATNGALKKQAVKSNGNWEHLWLDIMEVRFKGPMQRARYWRGSRNLLLMMNANTTAWVGLFEQSMNFSVHQTNPTFPKHPKAK